MKSYNHTAIERKWQGLWKKKGVYKTKESKGKKKFFVLDMFPYPSGEGLHVGHPKGYIATDIVSRMKNMEGYNVLHPMGFDAFGLPAENYAIKTKTNPAVGVAKNVKRYKKQLEILGFNYDWQREINTTDKGFYKWTQYMFLKFLENGLAYQSFEPINWCPSCKTGLANEDLNDGRCERCDSMVEKRPMRQWVIKITDYADRLLKDLDLLDWPEHIKTSQRNWIGKSEGAEIKFKVKSQNSGGGEEIIVFTTRPDTLFGATYLVVAPEHELISKNKSQIKNIKEVEKYLEGVKNKTEIERTDAKKEKTGVEIKGFKAINPANGEEIPVFVADYVLGDYGTGAVMAVPAHDERDFEFAKKYNLPKKEVVIPRLIDIKNPHIDGKEVVYREAIIAVVLNPKNKKVLCLKWKKQPWTTFVTGGVENGENPVDAATREIIEETGYKNIKFVKILGEAQSEFFAAHKDVNRIAHTHNMLFHLIDEEKDNVKKEEKDIHDCVWQDLSLLSKDNMTPLETDLILNRIKGDYPFVGDGILSNSLQFSKLENNKAKKEITKFVGGKWVSKYKLRDWVFSRQRYWGEPIPVIHCQKCGVVPVPEKDLPVVLPKIKNYEPTGTGESPLAKISSWVNVKCPKCKSPAKRETNTMPQWAGSSWYYLRYIDPKNNKNFVDKKKEKYWMKDGVDMYVGGDHAVRHLIYARFWHKFLYDLSLVSTKEPFKRLEFLGFILAEDGRKMSKRWGNVINPDDIVKTYGADTMRVYEMFMAPFSDTASWNTKSIIGSRRFLERVWRLQEKVLNNKSQIKNQKSKVKIPPNQNTKIEGLLHKTIKKVGEDIFGMKFNTAISSMMVLLNEMEKMEKIDKADFENFVLILSPFAPHLAEELWQILGHKESIVLQSWPKYNPKKILLEKINIGVQINGKVRGDIEVSLDVSEKEALDLAKNNREISKWIENKEIKKVIYIKGKILNILV